MVASTETIRNRPISLVRKVRLEDVCRAIEASTSTAHRGHPHDTIIIIEYKWIFHFRNRSLLRLKHDWRYARKSGIKVFRVGRGWILGSTLFKYSVGVSLVYISLHGDVCVIMLQFCARWCKIETGVYDAVFEQSWGCTLSDGFTWSTFSGLSLLSETGT